MLNYYILILNIIIYKFENHRIVNHLRFNFPRYFQAFHFKILIPILLFFINLRIQYIFFTLITFFQKFLLLINNN